MTALNATELDDTRRFCGYPVAAAIGRQTLEIQGLSIQLDGTLAALTDEQCSTIRTVYLANLYTLEAAIPAASSTLNVKQAAVFTRNPLEMDERRRLFDNWRQRLCYYLGVSSGNGVVDTVPGVFVV